MADSSVLRKSASAVSKNRQAARNGEGSSRKVMLSALLFICCCGAGYFTWSASRLLQSADDALRTVSASQQPDTAAEEEKNEIAAVEEGLNNLSKSSARAMQTALIAETRNSLPLGLPTALAATAPAVTAKMVTAPEPPLVTVVAVMLTDTDSAALIDVDDEREILVREGVRFSEGKATITKIDAKGVTFTWRKKSYQVTL
jgi:hypothetical protein